MRSGLTGHLAGTAHTRSIMLRLDLVDGTTLAITDHDRDLTYDLGDGAVTYSAGTGIMPSDLQLSTGFEGTDMEVDGPIGDVVTRAAVIGGRYDDATARLFQVNWADLTAGALKLLKGRVVLAEINAGQFKFTIQGDITRFSQTVGRVVTPFCDADFGDARCGYPVVPVAATVTAVVDALSFTVSTGSAYVDNYFNRGKLNFTSGVLNNGRPVEVLRWQASGDVQLWTPLPQPPQIGDTLMIQQGCSKVRQAQTLYSTFVDAVFDGAHFTTELAGHYPDDFFNGAMAVFTAGANDTAGPIAVSDFIGSDGTLVMTSAFPSLILPGQPLNITVPDTTAPSCMGYNNIVNFRGFPDVPGSDQVLRYPNPGNGSA